jgi:hypothetical protein
MVIHALLLTRDADRVCDPLYARVGAEVTGSISEYTGDCSAARVSHLVEAV